MKRGSIVSAPDGYEALSRGTDYYLIANSQHNPHVVLTWFTEDPRPEKASDRWCAEMLRLPRSNFEAGIESGCIVARDNEFAFPPWLRRLEGMNVNALEALRVSKEKSYQDYAQSRFQHISALIEHQETLFNAADLYRAVVEHANECSPPQRRDRIRLWLCTYLAFGQDIYSLSPAFPGIGTWDRELMAHPIQKLGRPNVKAGVKSGYSAIPLATQICEAYLKYATPGKSMTDIHADALSYYFGSKTTQDATGKLQFFHPEGKPIPTLSQFSYRVRKKFGLASIERTKYGDDRYRSRIATSKGKFSAATANLLESVEEDVYYTKDLPTRLLSNQPGLPLAVCRIVCSTSGYVAGVGFAYGSERAEAYRAAKFFAVAPKALLARMFAVDITDADFPCTGLSPKHITDRGAGHNATSVMRDEDKPPIQNMAPSWQGQSKATVESSHPRDIEMDGGPSYVQSDLNVFEMARREVLRAASDNNASDASARLTPEMVAAATRSNPNGIVHYLTNRGRVDAVSMPLDRAIRTFLEPLTFELDTTGLQSFGLYFDSDDFRKSGLDRRPRGQQRLTVTGYVLSLTVRISWIEHEGRLIEVEAKLPIRDDTTQKNMSLAELKANAVQLKGLQNEQRMQATAAKVDARNKLMAATGKEWSAGERVVGAAPSRAARGSDRKEVPAQSSVRRGRS